MLILFLLKRECLLHFRNRAEWVNPLLFFILVTMLFPFAMEPDPSLLQLMGTGIIWVAVLLATLLSLHNLFRHDYHDGSLDQWLLNSYPLAWLVFIKMMAHWLMLIIPFLCMAPLVALMFHLSAYSLFILEITLLLGTPILCLLGAIVAALTVALRQGSVLLALLLLPLYIPTLIFATSAVNAANNALLVSGPLALLGVLLIVTLLIAPIIAAAALRVGAMIF